MASADLMIGNSSAGIIEAGSFGTPVINVGTRQNLRQRNANVRDLVDLGPELQTALSETLAIGRLTAANVYGDGNAGRRIAALLKNYLLSPALLMKVNSY